MAQSNRPSDVEEVKRILSQIGDLEIQLKEIRSACTHTPDLGFNKDFEVKIYCTICKHDLGYPSLDEVYEFLKG